MLLTGPRHTRRTDPTEIKRLAAFISSAQCGATALALRATTHHHTNTEMKTQGAALQPRGRSPAPDGCRTKQPELDDKLNQMCKNEDAQQISDSVVFSWSHTPIAMVRTFTAGCWSGARRGLHRPLENFLGEAWTFEEGRQSSLKGRCCSRNL